MKHSLTDVGSLGGLEALLPTHTCCVVPSMHQYLRHRQTRSYRLKAAALCIFSSLQSEKSDLLAGHMHDQLCPIDHQRLSTRIELEVAYDLVPGLITEEDRYAHDAVPNIMQPGMRQCDFGKCHASHPMLLGKSLRGTHLTMTRLLSHCETHDFCCAVCHLAHV